MQKVSFPEVHMLLINTNLYSCENRTLLRTMRSGLLEHTSDIALTERVSQYCAWKQVRLQ